MIFETRTVPANEPKSISIFMGKLSSHTEDRILDAYGVDDVSFEKLVAYFKKQEKQDRFKALAGLCSLSGVKYESRGTIPMNQRSVRKITRRGYIYVETTSGLVPHATSGVTLPLLALCRNPVLSVVGRGI